MISAPKMMLILFLVLLVFGAKKLPQLGSGLGEGIRNFRNSLKDTLDAESAGKDSKSLGEPKA